MMAFFWEEILQESAPIISRNVFLYCVANIFITVAIFIDYKSGLRKARERGEKIVSSGRRRSFSKAIEYYSIMFFGFFFDSIISVVLFGMEVSPKAIIPYLSFIFCLIIIATEYKSVREKASDKIRSSMPNSIDVWTFIKETSKDPNASSILRNMANALDEKGKEVEDETK